MGDVLPCEVAFCWGRLVEDLVLAASRMAVEAGVVVGPMAGQVSASGVPRWLASDLGAS